MRYFKIATAMTLALTFNAHAEMNFDKSDNLNGVILASGKAEKIRSYSGKISKDFPYSLEMVKNGITNFSEKCNNDYKSKREYTSTEAECKYFNEHLVETFVVKNLKPVEAYKGVEHYLVGRQVYNRGTYTYYELVQIKNGVNDKNQKTMTISLEMLNDSEVKAFTEPKFGKDSAFDKSGSSYTLTEVGPGQTHMDYEYHAETDHWILNKEVSVPQVFASISKSINDLMRTVEAESSSQKRELASHQ
ncbi:hypothetical protein [Peredibacter starrii]|uniref:DUF4468 domain-containing protein n=1 Tax=Peredibacter starrii TaxID=28202 RepID=A0AAX4HS19_9BACT|nr:hypothetical protein [Peredibacter starrii]WPU66022.1 hypothetical protein SOO65_04620 [Peredibacter starrii]